MRRVFVSAVLAVFLAGACAGPGPDLPPGAHVIASSPAAAILEKAVDDVRVLSADDMEGRRVGSPGGEKARAYIKQRFASMGLAVVEQPFVFRKRDGGEVMGVNLVVRIAGKGKSDRVIVVTAHYDHLGVRDGQTYNGADDNASGVAALLAVAAKLKSERPRHTIYLVALDGEEGGLQGAKAFLNAPPVPAAYIALNVNFDMLAKNTKGELYAAGGSANDWVRSRVGTLSMATPVLLKQGHDTGPDDSFDNWTYQSDHGVFARAGIPWVYFGVEDHPEYHKPTDDFATVPVDFFKRSVGTVVMAVQMFDYDLDSLPERAK